MHTTIARALCGTQCRTGCEQAFAGSLTAHIASGEFVVVLIAYYVAFMIAGDLAAYAIGRLVELEFGSHVSLIVFLALYFLFLWVAWVLAVWLTKPEHAESEGVRSA
jgi:cation transporter-like permease